MVSNPKVIWNPYSPDYFRNPYPHLNACRESNPIQFGLHDAWIFFKYSHVSEIIRSPDFLVSDLSGYLKTKEPNIFDNNGCPYLAKGTQKWLLYLNGSEHKQLRATVGKTFNEFNFKEIIYQAMCALLEEFKDKNEFDLVDFCAFFPFYVMRIFFNLPQNYNIEQVKEYCNYIARVQDIYISKQSYREINQWFLWGNEMFDQIKDVNKTEIDFKSLIIRSGKKMGVEYSEEEINSIFSIALMAAFETSKDNLAITMLELLMKPKLIEQILKFNEAEINLLTEEIFRFGAPLHYTIRINKSKLVYTEFEIPANSKIYLCLASANRDPQQFKNPDLFVPLRKPNNHLSFGAGSHLCLGASIARQEIRLCIQPMLNFLKNYEVDFTKEIKYAKQILMHTISSAPVKRKI